ncbi:hypothetical protein B5X24_HaOG215180 [Helicoverpa armigera]|nr:hypothetical protein B5X24_HaOG215180 [Helicoverpa armigera]
MICDSDYLLYNKCGCVIWGSNTHDAYIWRECVIRSHLKGLQNDTVYLLGDSGYALREHMMTPIDKAVEDSLEGSNNFAELC